MSARCAVMDTNVLVSALLSPMGKPAEIYKMFLSGTLELVICPEIFEEYREVLLRPYLKIPVSDAEMVLAAIWQQAQKVTPITSTDPMPDEDDRVFYDAAKSANAYLITGNAKHYPQESVILSPAEFLDLQ